MARNIISMEELKKLGDQVDNAIVESKLYWLRNDAKIRACQNTQTYDEFRNIVNAAHLQPIKKKKPYLEEASSQ